MEKFNLWKEILISAIIFLLVTIVWQTFFKKRDGQKVYVIGRIIKSDTMQGVHYVGISYSYMDSVRMALVPAPDHVHVGDLFFIGIFQNAPDKAIFNPYKAVPRCLDTSHAPINGWLEIPECQ